MNEIDLIGSIYKDIMNLDHKLVELCALKSNTELILSLDSVRKNIKKNTEKIDYVYSRVLLLKQINNFSKHKLKKIAIDRKTSSCDSSVCLVNPFNKEISKIEKCNIKSNLICINAKDKDYIRFNHNNINLFWLDELKEFAVILNGRVLSGNLCDIHNNISKDKYLFYKKCKNTICKSKCKYIHKDIILYRNICGTISPSKSKLELTNFMSKDNIMSRDEFYIFEKKLMHDILVHQIISSKF